MGSLNPIHERDTEVPAMKSNPKFIFFTDFDGTITLQDSNDFMTDHLGFGTELRKQGNKDVLNGLKTFRQSFQEMMDSIRAPYDECIRYLVQHIKLDPHFTAFLEYALAHNIPVVVLSGGMRPVLEALLMHLVGADAERLQIVANGVRVRDGYKGLDEEGGWELVFRDESGFGHDKSRAIRPYGELPEGQRPTLFYAGDGVSDLSAARETDLLFAKRGCDLVTYCAREDIPFTVFNDWRDITSRVQKIVDGTTKVKQAAVEGYSVYKASNKASKLLGENIASQDGPRSGHTTPREPEAGGGARPLIRSLSSQQIFGLASVRRDEMH